MASYTAPMVWQTDQHNYGSCQHSMAQKGVTLWCALRAATWAAFGTVQPLLFTLYMQHLLLSACLLLLFGYALDFRCYIVLKGTAVRQLLCWGLGWLRL